MSPRIDDHMGDTTVFPHLEAFDPLLYGCKRGNSNQQPPPPPLTANYFVTVTATSGTLQHLAGVAVTVQ